MKQIKYTYLSPFGTDEEEIESDLLSFLLKIPDLFFMGYVPSITVLNNALGTGTVNAGCRWSPFTIDESEYTELIETLKSTGNRKFIFADVPETIQSYDQWHPWVLHHRLGVPLQEYLELSLNEKKLKHSRNRAYDDGNMDLAKQLHTQWLDAAEKTAELIAPYLKYDRR